MELPEALRPWSEILEMLPREVALSLGPWLQRLAPMVGPLRARVRRGAGEPDGYDGLTRRGGYERLLASEWLLAEEAPDEFLRRAATGELAFLQRVQRDPARALTSVALFDIGPTQLGAPRVVHLAALILLARRAAMAGARFGWGMLQKPPGATLPADKGGGPGLRLDVTRANLSQLLQSRSATPVSDEDLDAWAKLAGGERAWEDVWLVSGTDVHARWVRRMGARAGVTQGCVEVSDPVEPRQRQAAVRVLRGPLVRTLALDLPDDRTCVQFLRAPLVAMGEPAPPPPPKRVASSRVPVSNAVFSPSGTRVLARNAQGDLLVIQVPNSPRVAPGKAKIYSVGAREGIVAAGFAGKRVVVFARRGDELHLYDWSNRVFRVNESLRRFTDVDDALAVSESGGFLETLHIFRPYSEFVATVVDSRRRLLALHRDAITQVSEGVVALTVYEGRLKVVLEAAPTAKVVLPGVDVLGYAQHAFVGASGAAVCDDADGRTWTFPQRAAPARVTIRPGDRAVGFTHAGETPAVPQMLVVRDGHELVRVGESADRWGFRADSTIVHATADVYGARVACMSESGTLTVHELATGQCLLKVAPGG